MYQYGWRCCHREILEWSARSILKILCFLFLQGVRETNQHSSNKWVAEHSLTTAFLLGWKQFPVSSPYIDDSLMLAYQFTSGT